MYDYIVNDIEVLLRDLFRKNQSITLRTLVSTIDYRHRTPPDLDEINAALSKIAKYRIVRKGGRVSIRKADSVSTEMITRTDMDIIHRKRMNALIDLIAETQNSQESKESIREFIDDLKNRK